MEWFFTTTLGVTRYTTFGPWNRVLESARLSLDRPSVNLETATRGGAHPIKLLGAGVGRVHIPE